MAESNESKSKLKTTSIKFMSKASVKIKDNFYTVEACEERVLPEDATDVDWEKEKELLWTSVNTEVDNQIQDIFTTFGK